MPRIRPRRGSRRGMELSKPLLRVYTPEASGRPRERLSSRERFAHPAAVREASLVGIQTRADRSQGTGAGFHMCPCSGWVTPSTDLVDAITRSSGASLSVRICRTFTRASPVCPRARSFIRMADFLAQSFISGWGDAMPSRSAEGDRPCQPNKRHRSWSTPSGRPPRKCKG